ncbi:phosphorothioated DNA-binding restriction endonuclease [Actinomadura luteofluorescens]|uniref:phosphorothioated DNA-binding restriction endonuclease n=1 Tax=Actinomadura luteofluorescens TaxID=46163 RepID=UPI003474F7A4
MDWVERVTGVRRWSRGGERAPHKPLLLLYALGHFQRCGDAPMFYSEVERHLAGLLREFGPPRKTSPAYPFHHLTSDGLWEVQTVDGGSSPGAQVGLLRAQGARGRLSGELAGALRREPRLLAQLCRAILDVNFEPSLHDDICAAAGIDLESVETAGAGPRRRDRAFRELIMIAYEYRCAFCGYDGLLGETAVGLDAAHVRWWAFDGPDDVTNGICLCALHHKLFDKGALGITDDRRVTVSARFVGRGPAAREQVHALVGRPVSAPQTAFPAVDGEHIAWHAREVFRSPARAA